MTPAMQTWLQGDEKWAQKDAKMAAQKPLLRGVKRQMDAKSLQ